MNLQLVNDIAPVKRGLVVDPEGRHLRRMHQAIWLYLYLLLAVNPATGKRLLSPAITAREMGLKEETVRSWLGHLRRQGYVTVARQGDAVLVTVAKWPKTSPAVEAAPRSPRRTRAKPKPPLTPEYLAKSLGCAPDEPFLGEALAAADETTVRAALEKAMDVPKSRIRKSRLALFRYLILHEEDI